jgi:shikimate dehydrogenase
MNSFLDGDTRLHLCVGDPIGQVKSPTGLTRVFEERGENAICIPAHVAAADFDAFMRGVKRALNIDGMVITVPHKFSAFGHCDAVTDRARFLGAVNVMRRERNGGWRGDMTDGIALVAALRAAGFEPDGKRALLVGAGGAGSAVALALIEAGVSELGICELDPGRRDDLAERLTHRTGASVHAQSADPQGFDLVVNASPMGMSKDDPLPVATDRLDPQAFVADLVTRPPVTPLLEAARGRGCVIVTGADMFAPQAGILADFLLAARA